MASKPRRKKAKNGEKEPFFDEDGAALDAFCRVIELEETSFESWKTLHESIDITVPLFLTAAEAEAGLERQICFVRQITADQTQRRQTVKERAACWVSVPARSQEGYVVIVKNQGDRLGDRYGDVKVIIRFKA